MTHPRRVRRRYPKMPNVTVDDLDQLPEILGSPDPEAASGNIDDSPDAVAPGIRLYPGEVTAAISFWQPDATGRTAKYFDTRIRYVNREGSQKLRITVPVTEFLSIGTKVNVEEQAGGRIRVHRRTVLERGRSWRRPDIRGALIALAIIVALTAVIGVIGYIVGRSKQPQQSGPNPKVTVQSVVPSGSGGQPAQGSQGSPGSQAQQTKQPGH